MSGELTGNARQMIAAALKEDDRYASLMQSKTFTLSDMLEQVSLLEDSLQTLGLDY
jgi:hypothetical protein